MFTYLSTDELSIVKNTNGIVSYVYWLSQPVVISQDDIYLLKRFFNMYADIRVEKTKVILNQPASISSLFTDNGDDLVQFSFPALGYAMTAQENTTRVKVINVPGLAPN